MKLKNKLIIYFLLLSLVPTLIVGMFSYYMSHEAMKTKTIEYTQLIHHEISDSISANIEEIELICHEILIHDSVQWGLENYNTLDIMKKREIIEEISDYFLTRFQLLKYLVEVEIITNDSEVLYTSGYCSYSQEELNEIGDMAEGLGGMIGWGTVSLRGRDNILVYRQLFSESSREGIGFLIIALDSSLFENAYRDVSLGLDSDVFIIDSTGDVISTIKEDKNIGKAYSHREIYERIFVHNGQLEDSFSALVNGSKNLITYTVINDNRWALVSTVPYMNFNRESQMIMQSIIVVSLVCILTVVILSFMISKYMWAPLKSLVQHIKEIENGQLDIRVTTERNDEIGYLTRNFNNMVIRIEKLINEVRKEQKEKREMEIQMLQAQINPHFLFNTLNSLKWVAKISQVTSISDGIGALAEILRNTILDKNETVAIQEEVKNIENYVCIQRLRYGNRFKIEYDISEDVYELRILKFMLQPIVENAMIHGGEGIDDILNINLKIFRQDETVIIHIKDNGCGLDEAQVKGYLNEATRKRERISSIGIYNVNERVKLNYGKPYGLNIESVKGTGTRVIIKMPAIENSNSAF